MAFRDVHSENHVTARLRVRVLCWRLLTRRPNRGTAGCIGTLLMLSSGLPAASADVWSAWKATNAPLVEWRVRVQSFGKNMSPVCEFEFRATNDRSLNF